MKFFKKPAIESSLTYLVLAAVVLTMTGIGYFFFGGLLGGDGRVKGDFKVQALTIGDKTVDFTYTDDTEGEDIIIHSDKKTYIDFSGAPMYFSVTSINKKAEYISLQFLFPDDSARIAGVEQYIGDTP